MSTALYYSVSTYLLIPPIQIAKGLGASNIIDQDNCCTIFEVNLGDGLVSLLPSCVPDHELQFPAIHLDFLDYGLALHCAVVFGELIPHVSGENIGFTHCRVANNDELHHLLPLHQAREE